MPSPISQPPGSHPRGEACGWPYWRPRLAALCDGIRERTRAGLLEALRTDGGRRIAFPVGQGAGDVTFGLDVPSEEHIDHWLEQEARHRPLSVLTEDRGWRHRGPAPSGEGSVELPDFDHGGPRIAIDPIDGTRNLMHDLRSAWTVVSFAGSGHGQPRFSDVSAGLVSEIPTSRTNATRLFSAERGGPCLLEELGLGSAERSSRVIITDDDDRVDQGYFPIFRYQPDQRPAIARLEAGLFARLAQHEGADTRSVYDDQYISNAGQLVLLSLGTYRMFIDPRALVGERSGTKTVTSKPYDVAGALVCAAAAGASLSAADGSELDFPLDAETPVHFAGYVNAATRARIEPHWLATLADTAG